MDNPICLTCRLEEEQMAFLGRVPGENLLQIFNEATVALGQHVVHFVIATVKMVLGWAFLENGNRYHINTDIASQFLVSLLDLKGSKVNILLPLRKMFKVEYLGDDIDIVAHAKLGVWIPWADKIHKLLEPGQNVVL